MSKCEWDELRWLREQPEDETPREDYLFAKASWEDKERTRQLESEAREVRWETMRRRGTGE